MTPYFTEKMRKYFFGCRCFILLAKKVPSLIPTENGQMHPLISKKIYPFTYLELRSRNATCFREKFLKKNKKICPPEVASKEF